MHICLNINKYVYIYCIKKLLKYLDNLSVEIQLLLFKEQLLYLKSQLKLSDKQ